MDASILQARAATLRKTGNRENSSPPSASPKSTNPSFGSQPQNFALSLKPSTPNIAPSSTPPQFTLPKPTGGPKTGPKPVAPKPVKNKLGSRSSVDDSVITNSVSKQVDLFKQRSQTVNRPTTKASPPATGSYSVSEFSSQLMRPPIPVNPPIPTNPHPIQHQPPVHNPLQHMQRPPIPVQPQSYSQPPVADYDPDDLVDDAYDDIESVKEEMALYLSSTAGVPPPLPPMNTKPGPYENFLKKPLVGSASPNDQSFVPTPPSEAPSNRNSISSVKSLLTRAPLTSTSQRSLTLQELVQSHQQSFPLQIQVVGENGVISKGEQFNIHFIKTSKAVKMTTTTGTNVTVPVNSAIKFGVIYDPANQQQSAMQGYGFSTVHEIMSTAYLPPLVYVQSTYDTSTAESSIQTGEILALKEIGKHRFRGKNLTCTVVQTGETKKLLENCTGNFSTAPVDVRLCLNEILQYLTLPLNCLLYYDGPNAHEISNQLPGGVVTIQGQQNVDSLVVTRISDDIKLLELPLDASIKVEILPSNPLMKSALEDKTLNFYNSFTPASIDSASLLSSETPYQLQKQKLFASLITHTSSPSSSGVTLKLPQSLQGRKSSIVKSPSNLSDKIMPQREPRSQSPESVYDIPQAAIASLPPTPSSLNQAPTPRVGLPTTSFPLPVPIPQAAPVPQEPESEYDVPRAALLRNEMKGPEQNSLQSQIDLLKTENTALRSTVTILEKTVESLRIRIG